MTYINRYYVIDKDKQTHACQWLDNPFRLKCGISSRGILTKKLPKRTTVLLSNCRVCGCKVVIASIQV